MWHSAIMQASRKFLVTPPLLLKKISSGSTRLAWVLISAKPVFADND